MAPAAAAPGAKAKPRAALNPSFRWDGGADAAAPLPQAPWDFKGAAEEVEREHRATRTTPLDAKIAAALRAKGGGKAPKGQKAARPAAAPAAGRRGAAAAAAAAASEDEAEDDDDDDSEDEVLDAERESDSDHGDAEPAWRAAAEDDEEDDEVVAEEDSESGSGSDDEDAEDPYADARAGKLAARALAAAEQPARRPAPSAAPGAKAAAAAAAPPPLEDTFAVRRGRRAEAEEAAAPDDTWGHASERAGRRPAPEVAPMVGDARFCADSFAELGLSKPLLKACAALGYTQPTPIQAAVVPLGLTGRDICGRAVTGSGKTAAFMLPLLERLLHRARSAPATRVLVITPTRELAVQIAQMAERLAQFTDIRVALVVGGLSLGVQATALRARPEVVVATPGRLIDHLRNTHSFSLDELAALVLDEADRLLELGFSDELAELLRLCPARRQTLLFSATLTPAVERLAALSLQQPARLSADGLGAAPATLTQEIVRVRPAAVGDKEAIVLALLSRAFASERAIVFARTKARAHRLKIVAGLVGMTAAELHGDMTQAQRLASLESFRAGEAQVLIATDVAARGLDIASVGAVVSLDAPRDVASYLHRCGRTARAGAPGTAVTLAEEKDRPLLKALAAGGARGALKERRVDPAAIAAWRERLEGLSDALEHVTMLEKEEAVHRRADMEAAKAEHLLEHAEDIASRPARSWFQSEGDKLRAAKVARAAATKAPVAAQRKRKGGAEGAEEDDGAAAEQPKGKKSKKGERGERGGRDAPEEAADAGPRDGPRVSAKDDPAAVARRGAALAKGAARRALAQGLRPAAAKEAARVAIKKDAAKARRKQRMADAAAGGGNSGGGGGVGPAGLFAGDGINGSRPGLGGAARSGARSSFGAAAAGKAGGAGGRPMRTGSAPHKSGFKSKKRYKRR